MKKEVTFILIGAGNRGRCYTQNGCAHPGCRLVGVAEPNEDLREYMRKTYNVPADRCFESYEQLLALGKIADFAIIATQDKMHVAPALMAIDAGYDLLLEKPVAPTAEECLAVCRRAEEKNVRVVICHVLRYTPFCKAVKDIIDSGKIGKIQSVMHYEGVGHIHYSHSFVRGSWHNEAESSNMLLAKSCHDLDLLQWLLGSRCKKVQSFGRLSYFNKEHCPEGAPKRCIDDCPHSVTCPFNAVKIYRDRPDKWKAFREAAARKVDPSKEDLTRVLTDTNYGTCVFQGDNDVVDHQTVNLEYENGETVVFTMAAFNRGGRRIHIMGTKGELISTDFDTIELGIFCDEDPTSETYGMIRKDFIKTSENGISQTIDGGHGGGDWGIMEDLYQLYTEGKVSKSISSVRQSVENHLTVFAAEASRRNGGQVVDVDEFIETIK